MCHKEERTVHDSHTHRGLDNLASIRQDFGPVGAHMFVVGERESEVVLDEGGGQVGVVRDNIPSDNLLGFGVAMSIEHAQ